MGRKERRANVKKYGYSEKDISKVNEKSAKRFITIAVVILLFLVFLYFIVAIFVTKEIDLSGKDSSYDSGNQTTNSISNTILAKNTFRQSEEVYYVYYYDYNNTISSIDNMLNSISEKVYKVNTSDALNSNFVGDVGNSGALGIDDLKVVSPTLIRVEADTIKEYIEGESAIKNFLEK